MRVPPPLRFGPPLVLLVLGAPAARAHNGYPDTTSVALRQDHPEDLLLGATFGAVITRDRGASWHWVCPEALGYDSWNPERYLWQPDGTLLAATGAALLRSRDGGCTWQKHPFFTPSDKARPVQWTQGLDSLPTQPSRLWVTTGRPGQRNALYRSDDGGETFTATSLASDQDVYPSVRVAPSDPRRLYVSASTPQGPQLQRSDDEGLTWRTFPSPFPASLSTAKPYDLAVLRVSERDPDRLWTRITAGPWTYVLESRDGGQGFQSVLHPENQAEDGVDETLIGLDVSADGDTLWAATPTRLLRVRAGEPFATLLPLPSGNACAERQGGVLFVCGAARIHDWALATTRDEGATYTPLLDLRALRPSACPVGTPARDLCQPLWPQFAATIDANPALTSDPDAGTVLPEPPPVPAPAPKGCACAPGLPAAFLPLVLPWFRRSRRPRTWRSSNP